jgi:hypothetical protein
MNSAILVVLGNQMFQYAALRGIAAMQKDMIGAFHHLEHPELIIISLANCFLMEGVKSTNQYILDRGYAPVVAEKYFHFDEELLATLP